MKREPSVLTRPPTPDAQNRQVHPVQHRAVKLPHGRRNIAVAIYSSRASAEAAAQILLKADFDATAFTIINREYLGGFQAAAHRMRTWTWRGLCCGGVAGVLVSMGFLWVPGLRLLLLGGPWLNVILCVIQGSIIGGGLSALVAGLTPHVALFALGIPAARLPKYQALIKAGKCLLVIHGTGEVAARARAIAAATA